MAPDGYIRPGEYTSDDLMRLPQREWSAYSAEHACVKELGVVELKPIRSERENVVYVVPSRTELVGSFTPELLGALESKREVLRLERDLDRHLSILVERWDRSNEPEDTPVPEIPPRDRRPVDRARVATVVRRVPGVGRPPRGVVVARLHEREPVTAPSRRPGDGSFSVGERQSDARRGSDSSVDPRASLALPAT
jgi:hypothetical protein